MSLLDGVMVLGIFAALGGVIYVRLRERNPKFKQITDNISLDFIEKIPPIKIKPDKVEQVYNEKRTMM